jgi:hypothetical protein
MTETDNIAEQDFVVQVRDFLSNNFPTAEVKSEVYQSTDRFVDFVVDGDGFEIMVEVEDRAEDVEKGIMQAQMYSWANPEAMAMVVYPKGTGTVDPEVKGACPAVGVVEIDARGEDETR